MGLSMPNQSSQRQFTEEPTEQAARQATASGATVTLAIDGVAPITVGENRSVAITNDLTTSADPSKAAVTPLPPP